MRSELHEEAPNVNMMLRSGMTTSDDKGKQPEESAWVHKAPIKEPKFDLEHMKETFMEAKKSFMEASTSSSKDQLELQDHRDLSLGAWGQENRVWSGNLESMHCAQEWK